MSGESEGVFRVEDDVTRGPVELERMMTKNKVNVVDVRAADDYAEGYIPSAVIFRRISGIL